MTCHYVSSCLSTQHGALTRAADLLCLGASSQDSRLLGTVGPLTKGTSYTVMTAAAQ